MDVNTKKKLMIEDLSARIPYRPKVRYDYNRTYIPPTGPDTSLEPDMRTGEVIGLMNESVCINYVGEVDEWTPILRPMNLISDGEIIEIRELLNARPTGRVITEDNFKLETFGILWFCNMSEFETVSAEMMGIVIDYLNKHMLDWRHLIQQGLAIPADVDTYDY